VYIVAVPERKHPAHDDKRNVCGRTRKKNVQPLDADWYWGDVSRSVSLRFETTTTNNLVTTIIIRLILIPILKNVAHCPLDI